MNSNFKTIKQSIPTDFYNIDGKPFSHCSICECELQKSGTRYVIERAMRLGQVVFEYAICERCIRDAQSRWSEDSTNKIAMYMQSVPSFYDYIDEVNGILEDDQQGEVDLNRRMNHCAVHGISKDRDKEYQLMGMFEGSQMLVSIFPYMLSGKALDEITELISAETLGQLDDFSNELLKWPPELSDLNPNRRPILI